MTNNPETRPITDLPAGFIVPSGEVVREVEPRRAAEGH